MTDKQIERSIELIKEMLAQREAGANAKVIEAAAEPAALPARRNNSGIITASAAACGLICR